MNGWMNWMNGWMDGWMDGWNHSMVESDGQDSSMVQRLIMIASNPRHNLGHYCRRPLKWQRA